VLTRESKGIGIHDGRSQRSLRHLIHYVHDLCRILLLDYSDRTRDAIPTLPLKPSTGNGLRILPGASKPSCGEKPFGKNTPTHEESYQVT
jgi:hypothetical protein